MRAQDHPGSANHSMEESEALAMIVWLAENGALFVLGAIGGYFLVHQIMSGGSHE